jgi:hypothetical protein
VVAPDGRDQNVSRTPHRTFLDATSNVAREATTKPDPKKCRAAPYNTTAIAAGRRALGVRSSTIKEKNDDGKAPVCNSCTFNGDHPSLRL